LVVYIYRQLFFLALSSQNAVRMLSIVIYSLSLLCIFNIIS